MKIYKLIIPVICYFYFAIPCIYAQEFEADKFAVLNEYFERAEKFGFSGQVVVAKKGEPLFSESYGYSDEVNNELVSNETPFGIASISKQFTAAAILLLEQDQKLSVQDKISAYFKDIPDDKSEITIHQLLTHTSGIQGGDIVPDFAPINSDSLSTLILNSSLEFEPGRGWQYSNAGYNLLAMIVEKVSGQSFDKFLTDNIFDPSGMNNTGVIGRHRLEESGAHTYRDYIDYGDVTEWDFNIRTIGGGSIVSTAEDLFKWEKAITGDVIFSEVFQEKFFSPYFPIAQDSSEWYGYGWFILPETSKGLLIEHGGDTDLGFNGLFHRYVDEDLILILLNNRIRSYGWNQWMRWALIDDIRGILFDREYDMPPTLSSIQTKVPIEEISGTYEYENGDIARIEERAGKPFISLRGQELVSKLWVPDSLVKNAGLANSKTEELFTGLKNQEIEDSYEKALSEGGRPYLGDYLGEWNALITKYGRLKEFEILGTVKQPFDSRMRSYVHLTFENGETSMWLSWTENGEGRLSGTRVEKGLKIAGFVLEGSNEHEFIWYDLFLKNEVRFSLIEQKVLLFLKQE